MVRTKRLLVPGKLWLSAELKAVRCKRAYSPECSDETDRKNRSSYTTRIRSCGNLGTLLLRNVVPYDESTIVTRLSCHHDQAGRERYRIFSD